MIPIDNLFSIPISYVAKEESVCRLMLSDIFAPCHPYKSIALFTLTLQIPIRSINVRQAAACSSRFRGLQNAAGEPRVWRASPTVGFIQGASGDPWDRYAPLFLLAASTKGWNDKLPIKTHSYACPMLVGDSDKPSGFRSVKEPATKIGSSLGNTEKLSVCDKCGSGIV